MTIAPKSRPQKIDAPDGKGKLVLLPADDYDALMRAAEDLEDLRAAHAAIVAAAGAGECVPAPLAHRIADGQSPLRVWREHRGLKAIELARATGLSAAYISEIETGKKDGSFRAMAALASVLNISLDDLAPINNEEAKREREQSARIGALRDSTRALASLVTGNEDFNTAAMRNLATQLAADAMALKMQDANRDGWLDDILDGLRNVMELLEATESDIIEKAWQSRQKLAAIVASPAFDSERAELAEPLPEPPPMPKPNAAE